MRLGVIAFLAVAATSAFSAAPTGRYKAIVDQMTALQAKYKETSQIVSIGLDDQGTEILGLRVSTTPTLADSKKIAHLMVGTHHGNESAAPLLVMKFADAILKRYRSDELYRGTIADTEWMIVPVLNITGYNSNRRHELGIDSNRDYPGPCHSALGGKLRSIRTLMDHLKTRVYVGSVTVHGYVGTMTFPWGIDTTNTHSHDHNEFDKITRKAAEKNGYRYGTSTDLVYPATGTFEDYAYWKHGIWSLLLELKDGSAKDLENTTDAMLTYYDQLASSPSGQNQMTGKCQRSGRLDLGIE